MSPDIGKLNIVTAPWRGHNAHFRLGHIVVKVITPQGSTDSNDVRDALTAAFSSVIPHVPHTLVSEPIGTWTYVAVPSQTDIPALATQLNAKPMVDFAEPDLVLQASTTWPADEYLVADSDYEQWGLKAIGMDHAWDTQTGTTDTVIGLIDSGVPIDPTIWDDDLPDHLENLAGKIDHEDIDGGRLIAGYNYLFPVPESVPTQYYVYPYDSYGHGTNMLGILAARQNNVDGGGEIPAGIAGMNWASDVFVCTVIDALNKTTHALVNYAVHDFLAWAGDRNAVINLSLNYVDGDIPADTIDVIFESIVDAGAIICNSAGNTSGVVLQPALTAVATPEYASNLIVVGATTKTGTVWVQSGYGTDDMVFAPGERVGTTRNRTNSSDTQFYEIKSGTSEATAHVTGLVSLMWSEEPSKSAAEIAAALKEACVTPGSIADPSMIGHGVVDADEALDWVQCSHMWTALPMTMRRIMCRMMHFWQDIVAWFKNLF